MKISIIGSGYVGLTTGLGFASLGHEVICVDIDKDKVNSLNNGKMTIYENGLQKLLEDSLKKGLFRATVDMKNAIENSEISFITVGTPFNDGLDLRYVTNATTEMAKALNGKKGYHIIVMKSTVLPGTTENLMSILERYSGKAVGKDIGLCMNPEFLREGKALEDFLKPDRIIIGELDEKSGDNLRKLYRNFSAPVMRTNLKTAEMIKYASNTFLAAKISLINELGNVCKKLGIDTYDVARGIGYDKRISPYFLESGIGFGGSCFKKDLSALVHNAREIGIETSMTDAVLLINEKQPLKILEFLKDVSNKKIAILGVAFKSGTDDVREAPSIKIIKELLKRNAKISTYDPKAMDNMKKIFPDVKYCNSVKEALNNADACLVLTEWEEFKKLTDKDFSTMKTRIIIEGRRVLDRNKIRNFEGVCW